METEKHFTLEELSQLSGTPRRSIRWYIQQQLVDKPEGLNRGAYYLPRHLEQLITIRKWQEAGLSLNRIREIMGGSEGGILPPHPKRPGEVHVFSHILLARGVTLVIDPQEAKISTKQLQLLIKNILHMLQEENQNDTDEEKEKKEMDIVEEIKKEEDTGKNMIKTDS